MDKEIAVQFFRVRLLSHYESLDEDFRAEIPLKRIWTITAEEAEP